MAFIKCTECGREVSEKATTCPNCGCPLQHGRSPEIVKESALWQYPEQSGKSKKWVVVAILLCILAGGGYFMFTNFFASSGKDAVVELTPDFIEKIQQYDELGVFSDGMAAVQKNGKWGYINTTGKEVIPCQYTYDTVGAFSGEMAAVQKNGKWGYINIKGEEAIPVSIEALRANDCANGLAVIISDENSFYVIDKSGKNVFSGKCDFSQFGEDMDGYMRLTYAKEKLYIPAPSGKYAVYNKQGENIGEVEFEAKQELDAQDEKDNLYTIFSKANGDNEDYQWYTVGLKDENEKELVPAIYDGIENKALGEEIKVSNGVVLVVLKEYVGEVFEGYGDEWDSEDTKYYYGFADLKGNDTFTKEVRRRCRESKEMAAQQLFMKKVEEEKHTAETQHDWLQGTWTAKVNVFGVTKIAKLVIDSKYAKFYSDGNVLSQGEYEIYNSELHFDGTYFPIDESRQLIKVNDTNNFERSSQPSGNAVSLTSQSQNEEMQIMSKLHELGNKGKALISELSAMRSRGQIDPMRFMYIKQTLILYKDEQIRLAQKLGDSQMAREYQQQKDEVLMLFRKMESGY